MKTPPLFFRAQQAKVRLVLWALCIFVSGGVVVSNAYAAQNIMLQTQPSNIKFLQMKPGMTLKGLSLEPDSTLIEIAPEKRISLGELRRIDTARKKMMAAKHNSKLPLAFKLQPDPGNIKATLRSKADLGAALSRPDGDTLQLPSGETLTVAMLKLMRPMIEKKIGSIPGTGKGPVIKIDTSGGKKYWEKILQSPRGTVLQAPNGQRFTVSDLLTYLRETTGGAKSSRLGK